MYLIFHFQNKWSSLIKAEQRKEAGHEEICRAIPSPETSITTLKQEFHSITNRKVQYTDLKVPEATSTTTVVYAGLKFRHHCNRYHFKRLVDIWASRTMLSSAKKPSINKNGFCGSLRYHKLFQAVNVQLFWWQWGSKLGSVTYNYQECMHLHW